MVTSGPTQKSTRTCGMPLHTGGWGSLRGRGRLQGGVACKEILGLREPWWGKRSCGDQRDQRGRAWIRRLDLRRRLVDRAYMGEGRTWVRRLQRRRGDQRDQRGRAWVRRLDLRRRVVDSAYMGGGRTWVRRLQRRRGDQRDQRGRAWIRRLDLSRRLVDAGDGGISGPWGPGPTWGGRV